MKRVNPFSLLRSLYKIILVFFKSFFESFVQIIWGIVGLTLFMNIPVNVPSEALDSLKKITFLMIENWVFFLVILFLFSIYVNFQPLRRKEVLK